MAAVQIELDFAIAGPQPPAPDRCVMAGVGRGDRPGTTAAQRFTRQTLESVLREHLGEAVSLVITDNERTMISTRRTPGHRRVRLHHMFLDADVRTLAALGGYLDRTDSGAGEVLGGFIERHRENIRHRHRRRVAIHNGGKHHSLQSVFDQLNAEYFGGRVTARITWARRGASAGSRRRSIKLGSYNSRDELVRVHPALDAAWVPGLFVAYIVYHEMLHQVVPPRIAGGRRQLHGRDFCDAEREFNGYDGAIAWEKKNLRRLLRS